jgi:imidazolonepropionase-like amidohydrolase
MKNTTLKKENEVKLNSFVIVLLAVCFGISGFVQATETPQPKLTLISNVNIFDGKTETLHQNRHVLVKGNLIETISSEPLAVIQTDNVTVIDGGGRTLMPGLTDTHVHLAYTSIDQMSMITGHASYGYVRATVDAKGMLMRGVTSVRDMGGNVFGLKRAIDEGLIPGPRIYPSGAF